MSDKSGAKKRNIFVRFFYGLYDVFAGSLGKKFAWAILLSILYLQYLNTPFIEGIRNRSFDIYQRIAPRIEKTVSPVVVVDIDEKSIGALGQWPWSRDVLADLITKLTEAGAVVIGFDIVFPEPDRLSPPVLANQLKGLDAETRKRLSKMKGSDENFAAAIANSRVVLGGFISNDPSVLQTYTLERMPSINFIGVNPKKFVKPAAQYVGNVDVLEAAAAGYSNFSLDSDFDGIIRRIPLLNRVGDKLIPILGLEMLRVATGRNILVKSNPSGVEGVVIARSLIPTDGYGRMWIRYSKFDDANYFPAVDILQGKIGSAEIAGKLVLVGTSATGLKDLRSTPVNSVVPGVEVHAQMLKTVFEGDFLYRGDLMRAVEWLVILVFGLLLIVFVPRFGARTTFFSVLFAVGLAVICSAYLYIEMSILMDVTFLMGAVTFMYIALVYSGFRSAEQQRSQIRSAFSHYLSPEMVNKLTDSPDSLHLGGEVRRMTFLFCDIRGFTAISEKFSDDPVGLTDLINQFLTPMTDVILQHGGTIDKYMGDCIMAFWNAPLEDEAHARNALNAATEMQRRLKEVNETSRLRAEEEGGTFTEIAVGIGLNTGPCVVGNMGSDQRFDYSVLGDAVNLASRLEGQCKQYGMDIIVGEETYEEVDQQELLELDVIAVKGKDRAVRIFGSLAHHDAFLGSRVEQLKVLNEEMLALYRARAWDEAETKALECQAIYPELEKFYGLYLDRIHEFKKTPPDDSWTGIYISQTK
ncbi:CHASE2 domain-containing protein [Sneathiella sp.]|jgi:adenylate cyclase|uniref:CHASE2 domain-containing protein n=1 Tax=Sneathiella sp. TaxID=1964365 RepID=UPI0039E6769D